MNELTTQESNLPVEQNEFLTMDQSSMDVPKILLMQKMSELVDQEKVKPGDMVDSLTEQVLGYEKNTLDIMPLSCAKIWYRYVKEGSDNKFWKIEKFENNPNLQREQPDDVDGARVLTKNDLAMVWTVLLPSQVKSGEAMPYQLILKGMSYPTG